MDAIKDRRWRAKVVCRKGVLKNFANFTGNTRVSFFIKYEALLRSVYNSVKKETLQRCVNFAKFSRTLFYKTPPVVASEENDFWYYFDFFCW